MTRSTLLIALSSLGIALWPVLRRAYRARRTGRDLARPLLKQFADLCESDFDRYAVWIGCHTVDTDRPWYGETDEETFRPRLGPLPAHPSEGTLLSRASVRLADGSIFPGFVTASDRDDAGVLQPQVFAGGRRFALWRGSASGPPEDREDFYRAVGRRDEQVFPLTFRVEPGLVSGVSGGTVTGFLRVDPEGSVRSER